MVCCCYHYYSELYIINSNLYFIAGSRKGIGLVTLDRRNKCIHARQHVSFYRLSFTGLYSYLLLT